MEDIDFFGAGAGEFLERLDGGGRRRRRARDAADADADDDAAAATPGAARRKPTKKNRRAPQETTWRDRLADLMANMGGGLDDVGGGDDGSGGGGSGSGEGDVDRSSGSGSGDDDEGHDDEQGAQDDEEEEEDAEGMEARSQQEQKDEEEGDDDGGGGEDDDDDERQQQHPPTAAAAAAATATAPPALDRDLPTSEVLERIEALSCRLLERLVREGELPCLQMLRPQAAGAGAAGGGAGGSGASGNGDSSPRGNRHPQQRTPAAATRGGSLELSGSQADDEGEREGTEQEEDDDEQEQRQEDDGRCGGRRRPAARAVAAAAAQAARGARRTAGAANTGTRDMTSRNGRGALGVARVLRILAAVHEQLRAGRSSTQRDLYYHLTSAQRQPQQQQQRTAATATTSAARQAASGAAGRALFRSAADVSAALQDAVALLRVPRASLGVACCGKGAVAGASLSVREGGGPDSPWLSCSLAAAPAGRALPGDTGVASRWALRVAPGTAAILVVEKDAVFQRLLQDGLAGGGTGASGAAAAAAAGGLGSGGNGGGLPPLILVTARGFPDVATRCFLRRLVDAAGSDVPVYGLVDWNPAGVAILATYRFGGASGASGGGERGGGESGGRAPGGAGSARAALEAAPYALPELRWLGVTAQMLGVAGGEAGADDETDDEEDGGRDGAAAAVCPPPRAPAATAAAATPLAPLTPRDRAMAANLRARLSRAAPAWAEELRAMECPLTGGKADIEALYRGAGDAGGAAGGGGGGGGGSNNGGGLAADVAERVRWRRCI